MATPRGSQSDPGDPQSSPRSAKSSNGSSRNWFHRTLGRVAPESPVRPSLHRLRSLANIRNLTKRTSRPALTPEDEGRPVSAGFEQNNQLATRSTSRLPGDPQAPSGISTEPTQPDTPTSTESTRTSSLGDVKGSTDEVTYEVMGNSPSTASTIVRKPLPSQQSSGKQPLGSTESKGKQPLRSTEQTSSAPLQQGPPIQRPRSSTQVPIPRRRSSLTTLHLDRSHFEPVGLSRQGRRNLRSSSFSDSFHSKPPSSESFAPTPQPLTQEEPPRRAANSRPTSSSQRQSAISPTRTHIHLPATFPDGPIETPAPPLTRAHYHCFQEHRNFRYSQNRMCPVPCMTCKDPEGEHRWSCTFCSLRICGVCWAEFQINGRNLDGLIRWLADQTPKKKADTEAKADKETVDKPDPTRHDSMSTEKGNGAVLASSST